MKENFKNKEDVSQGMQIRPQVRALNWLTFASKKSF